MRPEIDATHQKSPKDEEPFQLRVAREKCFPPCALPLRHSFEEKRFADAGDAHARLGFALRAGELVDEHASGAQQEAHRVERRDGVAARGGGEDDGEQFFQDTEDREREGGPQDQTDSTVSKYVRLI